MRMEPYNNLLQDAAQGKCRYYIDFYENENQKPEESSFGRNVRLIGNYFNDNPTIGKITLAALSIITIIGLSLGTIAGIALAILAASPIVLAGIPIASYLMLKTPPIPQESIDSPYKQLLGDGEEKVRFEEADNPNENGHRDDLHDQVKDLCLRTGKNAKISIVRLTTNPETARYYFSFFQEKFKVQWTGGTWFNPCVTAEWETFDKLDIEKSNYDEDMILGALEPMREVLDNL